MANIQLQKGRGEDLCECTHGCPINREQDGGVSLFFLFPVADKACLSWLAAICKDPIVSPGLLCEAGVGVICHCQEMCCTQQGWLSSLLLLQQELQILKRCRTCTLQITIHHRRLCEPGRGHAPHGTDPGLTVAPDSLSCLDLGTRSL